MSASDLSNLWQNPKFNQYHPNYEPRCKTRLLLRHAVPLRHRAVQPVRRLVEPEPVRRGGAGPELREHPGPVRGVHRPREQHAAAVHRHHLLADEQGLAEPAVEPLQQRRRPGRQLLRRAGGQPAAARALRARQRHGHAGQPGQHDPVRAVGRGEGLQPGRHAAGRPDRQQHHAGQPAGADQRAHPEGARPAARSRSTSSSCCSSRTARSSTATSTGCRPSPTWSTGPRRWASRRAR